MSTGRDSLFSFMLVKIFNTNLRIIAILAGTLPLFIEHRLDFSQGDTFNSLEEVELFRNELEQDLINLRVFESVVVEIEIINNNVNLDIILNDAWGIIPIPYFGVHGY